MKKIIEFLKLIFGKVDDKENEYREKYKLNKKIDLRVTKGEYKLIKSYCELRGLTVSEYFRNLNMHYIDMFIQDNS